MNNEMTKLIEKDRFAEHVGIKLLEIDYGYAVAEMEIKEAHMNGVGVVHGGAIFTLADYAFAAASNSKGFVTLNINTSIAYYKSPKGKFITAVAKEITENKKLCGYNIDVFDENKELVARVTGTGYIKRNALNKE